MLGEISVQKLRQNNPGNKMYGKKQGQKKELFKILGEKFWSKIQAKFWLVKLPKKSW